MNIIQTEIRYVEDNFNVFTTQCCENCQLWAPEQRVSLKLNNADWHFTDVTAKITPLTVGACTISRRTGKDGETCYLQTHRTSGTFCRHHVPTPSYADWTRKHGTSCTAITPYIIHL